MRLRHLTTLTITAIAMAVPASAQAATCPGVTNVPTSASVAAAVQTTLCLANQQRDAAGVPPLTLEPGLSKMAEDYGRRMVAEQFFSHVSPDGGTLAQRLHAAGNDADTAGENLYWGEATLATPAATIDGWMNSKEHRENLLDPEFRRVGLAFVIGAPKAVAGPAATVVAEFDSGAPEATAHTSTVSPRASKPRHTPRATTPQRAVKAWFAAARRGDGQGFCRLQDNHMLGKLYGGGVRACLTVFHATPTLPAASQLRFAKVHKVGTKATGTVLSAGHEVPFVARRFHGHWKLDSLG